MIGAMRISGVVALAIAATSFAGHAQDAPAVAEDMSFFVTSRGRGFGANLGGLAGADAHCRQLAESVGRGARTWRAYLSTPATPRSAAVHARDRIGSGPWINAAGIEVASDLAHLHGAESGISIDTALTERGTRVDGSRHDILTGSNPDGTLAVDRTALRGGATPSEPDREPPSRESLDGFDTTCNGWTSHDAGRAMLGHHNRSGGGQRPTSWNSAHPSRGCSQRALRASLGDGLIYCFAAD